jgi:hypothetical protein
VVLVTRRRRIVAVIVAVMLFVIAGYVGLLGSTGTDDPFPADIPEVGMTE